MDFAKEAYQSLPLSLQLSFENDTVLILKLQWKVVASA